MPGSILSELENKPSAAKDLFSCERPNCSQRTVFEFVDCKVKRFNVLLIILLLFSFSACTLPTPVVSAGTAVTPPPVPETEAQPEPIVRQPNESVPRADSQTLNISMRPPQTLNPLINTDVTVDAVLKLIYEPLVALDETLKPTARLAEYFFSSDYSSVNLTIRNDAIWSDGTPVSTEDAAFSIETLRSAPDGAIYKSCVKNISSYEIIDTKTIKLIFTEVRGDSPYRLAFPLIPAHVLSAHVPDSDASPIGNGLYLFESLSPREKITLAQSPYTFRAQAKIPRIDVLFVPDRQTEIHSFNQGLVDVISMGVSEWTEQRSVKRIRSQDRLGTRFDFIGFNFNTPLMRLLEFREGVALSFDIDEAVKDVYTDHAVRAKTPINPVSWVGATPESVEYNAEAARLKFRAASEESPPEGYVRVLVNAENDERVKTARRLCDGMRACGMPSTLTVKPFDEFNEMISAGEFDIVVASWNLSMIPDLRFAFGSGGNILNYNDPLADDLISAAENAFSEAEYAGALAAVREFVARELPVVGLAFCNSAIITDERVRGDLLPSADDVFANINEWELE